MKLIRQLRHPKPDISHRVVADRSGRELVDLRSHYGHELRSFLYFYDQKLVLAAALTGTPGNIHAELRPPITHEEPVSDEHLGYMALESLLKFESRAVPSLANYKLTDWQTFKASRAPSVKEFNRRAIGVMLQTEFGGIMLEAKSLVSDDSVFSAKAWAPISVEHATLGSLLRKLVVGAKALQDAGVV